MSRSRGGDRARPRATALLFACAAACGCGGGPQPRPAPAPRAQPQPTTPAPEPARPEASAPEPVEAETSAAPAESPARERRAAPLEELTLRVRGPEGSWLRFGGEELELPGELSLRLAALEPCALTGRLGLNELAKALEIPSSASPHLREDRAGVWVEVGGSLLVSRGGAAEVELDREALQTLLAKRKLELGDGRRIRLRLTLE